MSWIMRVLALVVALGFALPLLADDAKKPDAAKKDDKKADDKKTDDPKPDDKKKEDEKKEKLYPAGSLQGKVTKVDADKKTVKVEVTYSVQKPNNDEYKAYMDAQNRYQQALAKRDRNGANQAMNDMATHYAKLYTTEKKTQEVEVQIMDDAKIRIANPPVKFDDDGKAVKYTAKELKELKGDPKLPGYPAEFDAITTNSLVQVTMVRKKPAKPTHPVVAPKPKELVPAEDALADNLPLVSVIVVAPAPPEKK